MKSPLAKKYNLGPTGKFPAGRLDQNDGGELKAAVYLQHNRLIIEWGVPIDWVGLDKAGALEMAKVIKEKAEKLPDN